MATPEVDASEIPGLQRLRPRTSNTREVTRHLGTIAGRLIGATARAVVAAPTSVRFISSSEAGWPEVLCHQL